MDYWELKRILGNLLKAIEEHTRRQHFQWYKEISGPSTRDRQNARSL